MNEYVLLPTRVVPLYVYRIAEALPTDHVVGTVKVALAVPALSDCVDVWPPLSDHVILWLNAESATVRVMPMVCPCITLDLFSVPVDLLVTLYVIVIVIAQVERIDAHVLPDSRSAFVVRVRFPPVRAKDSAADESNEMLPDCDPPSDAERLRVPIVPILILGFCDV